MVFFEVENSCMVGSRYLMLILIKKYCSSNNLMKASSARQFSEVIFREWGEIPM